MDSLGALGDFIREHLHTVHPEYEAPLWRILKQLFEDSGLAAPDNLSLYLNRLIERGFISCPPGSSGKNRYAVLTPEGRAHLDLRSGV